MQAEPLFHWSEVAHEYLSFVAVFLAAGAVGFRYAALRGRSVAAVAAPAGTRAAGGDPGGAGVALVTAAQRAAMLGLVGILVSTVLYLQALPALAERRHLAVGALVSSDLPTMFRLTLGLLGVLGFLLAAVRRPIGWPLAALGVLAPVGAAALRGQWTGLVNPVHMLMAGLWIGTLFVLVTAGLSAVLQDERARAQRGALAADMVNGFSPLALVSAGGLVLSGLVTGWRHLRGDLSNLWTTPYGWTLVAKLCVVAVVFALGAWNWRRQRPQLGTDDAAAAIKRSSTMELAVAGVVLLLTAILVSIPSPRPPGAPAATPASPAATPPAVQTPPAP